MRDRIRRKRYKFWKKVDAVKANREQRCNDEEILKWQGVGPDSTWIVNDIKDVDTK